MKISAVIVIPISLMSMMSTSVEGGHRRAQLDPIGIDYLPLTDVTDHVSTVILPIDCTIFCLLKSLTSNNNSCLILFVSRFQLSIAFDHEIIESLLKKLVALNLRPAKLVYEQGYGSLPYAEVTLDESLPQDISEGTRITGVNADGNEVIGSALEFLPAGSTIIKIRYEIQDGATFRTCRVGGAPEVFRMIDGCKYSLGVSIFLGSFVAF